MSSINLIDSFEDFREAENIDRPTFVRVVEDVFQTMLKRKYGTDENFTVIINDNTGDLNIIHHRVIVEDGEVENDLAEVSLSEAQKVDEDYEVGEELNIEIDVLDFGRRAILAAKQTLAARISDLKKNNLYLEYKERVGEMVTVEVYQVWRKEIMVLDEEGNELLIPKYHQIPGDFFKKGEMVRAVVLEPEIRNNSPVIVLSRTHPTFLQRLMEIEVPEIADGIIAIRKIVREPGERAKVAVESFDDRIDPVGACVGMKGSRIHGIVRELKNENIDIINYTTNESLLIQRSLTPARINRMSINGNRVDVYLDVDQIALAIGRRGVNIKLAQELTGMSIEVKKDIKNEAEFDINIDEFRDEIDDWVIDSLKKVGCDTALSVLELSIEELARRADLEEETVRDVRAIMEAEFEAEMNESGDLDEESGDDDLYEETDEFLDGNESEDEENEEHVEGEIEEGDDELEEDEEV